MFTIWRVIKFPKAIKLPTAFSIGSLLILILLISFTNPLNSVVAVAFFFLFLTVFLVTFSYNFLGLQGDVTPQARRRVLMLCATLILIIMLRSAKALNLLDTGLMILFFVGLTFYINRR